MFEEATFATLCARGRAAARDSMGEAAGPGRKSSVTHSTASMEVETVGGMAAEFCLLSLSRLYSAMKVSWLFVISSSMS